VLTVLVELPIVLPPAVAGLALLLTLGRRGTFGPLLESLNIILPFSTMAVILAQAFVAAPFYIRAAQVGFHGIPREIEDAARVDGAGGLALFFRVTAPLAARALGAGIVLCWARKTSSPAAARTPCARWMASGKLLSGLLCWTPM
jgi:molybdate transport system permease protein